MSAAQQVGWRAGPFLPRLDLTILAIFQIERVEQCEFLLSMQNIKMAIAEEGDHLFACYFRQA
jgi:hypothetical protein